MPALVRHPDTPCAAVTRIDASAIRDHPEILTLYFTLIGDLSGVAIPPERTPTRRDELWKQTCFEVFILKPDGGYLEFNFSPSSEWAAYEFDTYREAMRNAAVPPPQILYGMDAGQLSLRAELDFSNSMHLIPEGDLTMALTAVIEENSGAKSYWALKHPPGKPDFHHPDGFDLNLSAEG